MRDRKIRVGIVGTGYIGGSHMETLRRIPYVELAAVAGGNYGRAQKKAAEFGVDVCHATMDDLINDPTLDAVHNCTPNHLHNEVNAKIIKAGKHVFSEKPLARTSEESAEILALLRQHPGIVAGVNFCYRMNPLIQDTKNRIAAGEIGRPLLVHGSYLQDWLLYETDYNWRVETAFAGPSRCVGDIGSHWLDTAQVLVGSRVTAVSAETVIVHPVRKKPTAAVETFSRSTDTDTVDVPVETEDFAAALLRFENGVTGVFSCSQVSAGRKCFIDIEVDGTKASYHWNHETSDRMWMGHRDRQNEQIMRNPNLMTEAARRYTYLGAGHPEGWNDAFKNTLTAFYSFIRDGRKPGVDACDFATFDDAHHIMKITDAIMASGRTGRWVEID